MVLKLLLVALIIGLAIYGGVSFYKDYTKEEINVILNQDIKDNQYLERVELYYELGKPEVVYEKQNDKFVEVEVNG